MNAPDYQTLYRFEELISATLECLFNDAELKPKSVNSKPEFQSNRSRVEVFIQPGARFDNHYVLDAEGNRRENGWSGNFILTAITTADLNIHSAYLAAIRNLAATLDQKDLSIAPEDWDSQNGENPFEPLQFHEISQIKTAGTTSFIKPQDGEYHSKLNYEFIFAIRADAWPGGLKTA